MQKIIRCLFKEFLLHNVKMTIEKKMNFIATIYLPSYLLDTVQMKQKIIQT